MRIRIRNQLPKIIRIRSTWILNQRNRKLFSIRNTEILYRRNRKLFSLRNTDILNQRNSKLFSIRRPQHRDFESDEKEIVLYPQQPGLWIGGRGNCSLSATNGILNRRKRLLFSIRSTGCRTGAACASTCSATEHPSIRARSAARHSPHHSTSIGIQSGSVLGTLSAVQMNINCRE